MSPHTFRRTWADLQPRDHVCCLYETEAEHWAVLLPFLCQGLERGEKVLYIVDAHTAETILGYLRAEGVAVEAYLASGQLRVLTSDDTYLRQRVFDPEGMIGLLRAETERALAEGYPALRATDEMTWALRGLPGSERLIEYEAKLNDFLPGSQCLAMCQYDRRRFDPAVLLDVLHTHPIAAIGTEICDNHFFVPPAAFLENRPVARLQQWVQALAARKRAEEDLRRVGRGLKVLSACNQTLLRATDEVALLHDICRIAVETGGYRLAWVGIAEQDAGKTVRPVAQWGYEEGYLATLGITWADAHRGRGPTGTAIRTGAPVIARDIPADPNFAPWRAEAEERGYASSLALPLTAEGQILGALNIYAKERDAFDPGEMKLLTELADDLAFGIASLRARRAHEQAEVARQALYQASLEMQAARPLEERLALLLRIAQDVLRVDGTAIFLSAPDGRWLHGMAALGIGESITPLRVPIGPAGGALAKAFTTREAVVWDGAAPVPADLRLPAPYDRVSSLRARVFAIVPLLVQARAIGVLGVHRKHSRQPFDSATRELLQLFASHAAPAIEHARLYEELRRATICLEATVEDRTRDLRRANEELRAASQHKSEFLASMSHELRTPLNSILGFAQILLEQTPAVLTAKQQRYLSHISNSGQHLLQLISDILDINKAEAGKFVLQPEALLVAVTLEDILVIARGLALKKGQDIQADIAPGLPALRADPVRFKQILFNLLSNAVKFTPDKGTIRLVARRSSANSAFLEIRVTDTGAGIRAEDLPRLFQEFVQLETTQAQRHEGTGLGLALTQRLVEMHGGSITAESAGEGQGSTFAMQLPFAGPTHPTDTTARTSP